VPLPNGVAKREASAYPGTGLVIAIYDDLVIAYVLDGDVVLFLRVQERADLQRTRRNCFATAPDHTGR
jgi:hypothetical protein